MPIFVGNTTVNTSISSLTIGTDAIVSIDNNALIYGNTTITATINATGITYDSVSTSALSALPTGLQFSPDGKRMYIVDNNADRINVFNLSAAWNVATSSYLTNTSVTSQTTAPAGLYIKPDGTKAYVVGQESSFNVFQYSLNEAWGNSFTYDSIFVSVGDKANTDIINGSPASGPLDVALSTDGKYLYVLCDIPATASIFRYTMATAWDITSAVYDSTLNINNDENAASGITFSSDGILMFIVGTNGDEINTYKLSTPWDITTATNIGVTSVAAQELSPHGIFVKSDLTKCYIVGTTADTVFQYSIPSAAVNLTGTTNINGVVNVSEYINTYEANVASLLRVGSATVNSTLFSGTANNANNLGGTSLSTIQSQITSNAATAYTNATSFASNATNLSSGTVSAARLGSGTANSTTFLRGDQAWSAVVSDVYTGSTANNISFPIGTTLLVSTGSTPPQNSSAATIYVPNNATANQYQLSATSSVALTGNWRARGSFVTAADEFGTPTSSFALFQRVT